MDKVTLEQVVDAVGVEMRNGMTGDLIERTGMKAILAMDLPTTPVGAKLRFDLGMLERKMEIHTKMYERTRKDMSDKAHEKALGADGKPIQVPDKQGSMGDAYKITREKSLEVETALRALLDGGVEIDRTAKLEWPVIDVTDPKDKNVSRVVPKASDIALTLDFIDYSKACA